MTTVPLYTYKLLNSQNQLEIGLPNHLAQQVRMIFTFNIEFLARFLRRRHYIMNHIIRKTRICGLYFIAETVVQLNIVGFVSRFSSNFSRKPTHRHLSLFDLCNIERPSQVQLSSCHGYSCTQHT